MNVATLWTGGRNTHRGARLRATNQWRSVRPAGDGDEAPPERAPRCLHDPGRRPTGSAAGGGEIS